MISLCFADTENSLHMSPISNGLFLAAAALQKPRQGLQLPGRRTRGTWVWGQVRGSGGKVRGQVTFVSQDGTLDPDLWVASA